MSIIDPIRTRVDLAQLDLGFGQFPNAQPFSPRDAIGYQALLESMYAYLVRDVYTALTQTSGQATWDANVDLLLTAIDSVLAQQKSDIDNEVEAALQQLITATIAVTDPIIDGVLGNHSSNSYINLIAAIKNEFDSRYVRATTNQVNAITGWFHVDQFGAKGDGTTDDRAAVQAAVDAANAAYTATAARQKVYFASKVYALGNVNYYKPDGTTVYGVVSIMAKDGVDLFGAGTLKVKDAAYGNNAFYGIIRSSGNGLSHASVKGLTFDGNIANNPTSGNGTTTSQCQNIMLYVKTNVEVSETTHLTANGCAIQLIGGGGVGTGLHVYRNRISSARNIGIQCSHFDGLEIGDNVVSNTGDNAIDLYGENNGSVTSDSQNFLVKGNRIRSCRKGVFLETVMNGLVNGNHIANCIDEGVHVNRINGQPRNLFITTNEIQGTPVGVTCTGDMGGITIKDNLILGVSVAGVQIGSSPSVSYIWVLGNVIESATLNSTPLVLVPSGTGTVSNIRVKGTITQNTNRSFDFVNNASATGGGMNISAANAA